MILKSIRPSSEKKNLVLLRITYFRGQAEEKSGLIQTNSQPFPDWTPHFGLRKDKNIVSKSWISRAGLLGPESSSTLWLNLIAEGPRHDSIENHHLPIGVCSNETQL